MRKLGITIQLDRDMYEQLRILADKNRISLAAQIRLLIANKLSENEPNK